MNTAGLIARDSILDGSTIALCSPECVDMSQGSLQGVVRRGNGYKRAQSLRARSLVPDR